MSSKFAALLVAVIGVMHAAPALAQSAQYVGRAKCVNCHDHDNEKLWSEKKDGPPPKNHLNALKQMESDKSKGFADAIGLKDPYDANGACVQCHATVLKKNASNGVTCETCHGPGSEYLEPHQKKDWYSKTSSKQGMNELVKAPNVWAPLCVNCHIMDDQRLITAKHPSGDDFELGAKFSTVADGHWKNKYDKGTIPAAGKAATAALIAKRQGKPAAPVTAAAPNAPVASPAPPAPTPPSPPAAPPAPAPPAPGAAPPVTTTSLNPPPAAPPRGTAMPTNPPPAAPVRGGGATAANPPGTATPSARSTTTVDNTPARRPATSPVVNSLPPAPPAAPPVVDEKTVAAAPPPRPATTPVMATAEIQGRTLALINTLLVRRATAPVRVTPPDTSKYSGVESELLQLQREVLSLAIEALATPPPVEDKDKPPAKR